MKYVSFSKKKTCKTKVVIFEGCGLLTINNLSIKKYFGNIYNKNYLLIPIILSNLKNFDFIIKTKGSGKISQIFSIKIAICKCILLFNYKFKKIFRKLNFFSIDNRIVERKKYGKKKSRKLEQYSKR
ncbi:30S ribosomal protein S9 [Candidatus Carsonella ruddii]|uniref:Small ribosomal subunit protein uS9 n=1 Tax=Carsonella ruddii TaxID=114186 RepID=A0AAE7KLX2_CARRU|nr:30S ribosomal protein S9 [Candidatus Carsonella ruddii]AGS06547.1 30S ribosomal protein S9 [Candidatus Carsonella ruddii DC]ALA96804.1 hypothetical protein AMC76_00310 [Candidatus Carsonella ruddii]QLK14028.1 30S ribosomal protein S9 [Candidatus Carsonella ruddii]